MQIEKQGKSTIFLGSNYSRSAQDDKVWLDNLLACIPHKPSSLVVCSQENIWAHHGETLLTQLAGLEYPIHIQLFPDGEDCKTLKHYGTVLEEMVHLGCDRKSAILAFGGGTVGDSAGFIAATFMRGISWVYVPTTLLAMQDASVGGKVAINLRHGKNLAGSFWQPEGVYIQMEYLATLPNRHFLAGSMELIKHGVLEGGTLYQDMFQFPRAYDSDHTSYEAIVHRGIRTKINVVNIDFKEEGLRKSLNLGHTLAHALEKVSKYELYHGEAVGFGLIFACCLAQELGYLFDWSPLFTFILHRLPLGLIQDLFHENPEMKNLLFHTTYDKKKTAGKVTWIIPETPGHISFSDQISETVMARAFEKWMSLIKV